MAPPVRSTVTFQSTLPGWGATGTQGPAIARHHDFNPRSPDGERPGDHSDRSGDAISIHAPRMGSDRMQSMPPPPNSLFQSTLPGWGATLHSSICTADDPFQSTLPGWGATFQCLRSRQSFAISIHAPRMGSDPPTGCDSRYTQTISIHAPRMGSDLRRVLSCRFCGISIHAPRMGSDLPIRLLALPFAAFQSTLPGWGATPRTPLQYANLALFQSTLPGWGATLAS